MPGGSQSRAWPPPAVKRHDARIAKMKRRDLQIVLALATLTLTVFWPVGEHEFLAYDDPGYVSRNPHVAGGLTTEGAAWAFSTFHLANWHPLTWLSHMADVSLFGLDPGPHHLVNLALHAVSALALYAALRIMTGACWPSALVAALFAVHPAHVESVAWISERKDLLGGLFWNATILAYVRYVARPGLVRYALVFAALALGLMAKPMLVSLPLVLLLLDFWPLGRIARGSGPRQRHGPEPREGDLDSRPQPASHPGHTRDVVSAARAPGAALAPSAARLVVEKVPLLALAAASCIVTFVAQRAGGAMAPVEALPPGLRLANAAISYWRYAATLVWPFGLSPFYPYPSGWPWWRTLASAVALAGVTFLAIRFARQRPYIAVGWLWYLVTLVPVIGLVQVGNQSMADRYTYLPAVGLFIATAWGGAEIAGRWRLPRPAVVVLVAAILAGLSLRARDQTAVWRDTATLFGHALVLDPTNAQAHNILGFELAGRGRLVEAESHFRDALHFKPGYTSAHYNLGLALARRGAFEEAAEHLRRVVAGRPGFGEAHKNLGGVQEQLGDLASAEASYAEAVRLDPLDAESHNHLAAALFARSALTEAIAQYEESIRLRPDYADALSNLGAALSAAGRTQEAKGRYLQALQAQPAHADARYNLGMLLLAERQYAEAAEHLRAVLRVRPDSVDALAAYRLATERAGARQRDDPP